MSLVILLGHSSGCSLEEQARSWLQALNLNPQAAPPKGLGLGDLINLSWPAAVRSEKLAVAQFTTLRLQSSNAWPARRCSRFATSYTEHGLTPRFLQRAERRFWTRSLVTLRAAINIAADFLLKIVSKLMLGPIEKP